MVYDKVHIITSALNAPDTNILLIYTGGTLGMVHDARGSLVPFDFASILDHVPSLRQLDLNLTVISFKPPIDSSDMTPEHWMEIGTIIHDNYAEYDGFVVLHGTDTMAYTASAISFMLENLSKPVIFTGAQLPISSLRSDARENLITSLQIASATQKGRPVVPEVTIFFNNILLRANRAKKVESVFFDAFESENYPQLAEAGVVIHYAMTMLHVPDYNLPLRFHGKFCDDIALLKLYPGISRTAMRAVLQIPGLRGVIMETFGAGNAISAAWFIRELEEAIGRNVVILNISQCNGGRVMQGRYSTSEQLERIGVVSGADLTLEAALAKLMIILAEERDTSAVKKRLIEAVCGEMTIL